MLDGSGERADTGELSFSAASSREMSVELMADLSPGFYTVAWETLSTVDGHLLR